MSTSSSGKEIKTVLRGRGCLYKNKYLFQVKVKEAENIGDQSN